MQEGKETLTQVFKRIAGSFVYWYNWKYHRTGHLFQDRFKSEPVEDDAYFLTVLRYIHQNPVKAQICKTTEAYAYSSMREYLSHPVIADTGFALSMLSKDELLAFHQQENDDRCMEMEEGFRPTDDDVKRWILKITKCQNISEFQLLDCKKRNAYIHKLHENGASIRQISRLTGISKKIVERNI